MRVFRTPKRTLMSEKFNITKIIIVAIIIIQFVLNGIFLYSLNSKIDNMIKGSADNFGNVRQLLNQISVRQYQIQAEVRRMRVK
jgi:hypothetical protein